MNLENSASKQLDFLDSITTSELHSTGNTTSELTGQKRTDPNVLGDISEYYAITYLLDQGFMVFRNTCCTGPVDLLAITPEGETILIDVKTIRSERDYNVSSVRSPLQKQMGVQILDFDVATRTFSWKKHRE